MSQDQCSAVSDSEGLSRKDHTTQKSNDGRITGSCKSFSSLDETELQTQLSMNLWKRLNAGYIVPNRPRIGVYKSTYTYDPTLVEKKSLEFHRKRDFYSDYNEVAARFKLVLGNKKPLLKKKDNGKEGNDNKKLARPSSATGSTGEAPQSNAPTNTTIGADS